MMLDLIASILLLTFSILHSYKHLLLCLLLHFGFLSSDKIKKVYVTTSISEKTIQKLSEKQNSTYT